MGFDQWGNAQLQVHRLGTFHVEEIGMENLEAGYWLERPILLLRCREPFGNCYGEPRERHAIYRVVGMGVDAVVSRICPNALKLKPLTDIPHRWDILSAHGERFGDLPMQQNLENGRTCGRLRTAPCEIC